MRIVLDLQGAQNESRFRGIGRYSLSLAAEIARQATAHEIHVVLNGGMPDTVAGIRGALQGLIAPDRIHLFDVPVPTAECDPANGWRARAAELVREHALASLRPDVVHISSLFEGFADDVVGSVGLSALDVPTVVTLYDLIPMLDPDTYLQGAASRAWYERKLRTARRADRLLAISRSSAEEARAGLGIAPDRIVVIGTGVDAQFQPPTPDPERDVDIRHLYGLEGPFLLYAGAADPRKNLRGLLQAMALLPDALRGTHLLACAGKISPSERQDLIAYGAALGLDHHRLLFLGYVPDADLVVLYSLCALFVFPSFHEGFGLPAAEAMACGAPVIGSNATSIPEVIGCTEALFDPASARDIARCISGFLGSASRTDVLRQHGIRQAATFTWGEAARRAIAAYEDVAAAHAARPALQTVVSAQGWRTALVHSAPRFGAGDLVRIVRDMLTATQQVICVEVGNRSSRLAWTEERFLAEAADFDAIVYMPDGPAEAATFVRLMQAWPGIMLPSIGDPAVPSSHDANQKAPLQRALYRARGLPAVVRDSQNIAPMEACDPVREMLHTIADGILVHSQQQVDAACYWHGPAIAERMQVVAPPDHAATTVMEWDLAIRTLARRTRPLGTSLLQSVVELAAVPGPGDLERLARSIASNLPRVGQPQILVDVSTLAEVDARSGIQRVVRSILSSLAADAPPGWRIEPVRYQGDGYVYARSFSSRFFGLAQNSLPPDEIVETHRGDIFLGLDLVAQAVPGLESWFRAQSLRGVKIVFVVYDLLPIQWPQRFPPFLTPVFRDWIRTLSRVADGIIGISHAVMTDVEAWFKAHGVVNRDTRFDWFHLGADLTASMPSTGLPRDVAAVLASMSRQPFLMSVGTIEPRKGYGQTLDAFEQLWANGVEIGLVIVGQPGWGTEALVARLAKHPERNRRLFWLADASDEMLVRIYKTAYGLLAASEGEGFGLPLIEAAQHGLPILARDLPVFREIAGNNATYFSAQTPGALAISVQNWLTAWADDRHIRSDDMSWLTWKQSTARLLDVLLRLDPLASPDPMHSSADALFLDNSPTHPEIVAS